MSKQWFVLSTLTGQEQKVQRLIRAKASEGEVDMAPFIGELAMPTERVLVSRNGRQKAVTRKLFPGYVFAELDLYKDVRRKQFNKELWQFINSIDGVICFLGSERNARGEMVRPPIPMTDDEVEAVLAAGKSAEERPRPDVDYQPGEQVKIVSGAFVGSVGTVASVTPDRSRLTVNVSIFGGDIPVDVESYQVERYVPKDDKTPGS
jgi:transcriptional antiterminator NusG